MEINGLPLHPLLVHGTVVFVPLGALGAILYVVPKWRWLLRWPTLLVNLAAAVLVQLSIMSGEDLERDRKLFSPQVERHEEWADKLRIAVFILAVIVIVAFWALGYVTRLAGGTDRESKVPALETAMMVLLPIAGVAVLVLVFLTGDAGAKAVWG
jgi:magnesium-transporting ATPase (P-type)